MFVNFVKNEKFAVTEKGDLKQNERNALRVRIVSALADLLSENDVATVSVKDGLVIEFTNDELGSIPVVVSVTMKNLQYDVVTAEKEFQDLQAKRLAKENEKKKTE